MSDTFARKNERPDDLLIFVLNNQIVLTTRNVMKENYKARTLDIKRKFVYARSGQQFFYCGKTSKTTPYYKSGLRLFLPSI